MDRKTIDIIHDPGGHPLRGDFPPTPEDLLPEIPRRKPGPIPLATKTQRLLQSLGVGNPRSRLEHLDEGKLIELRASSRHPLVIDFPVDEASFREWDERLSDLGGYEYNAREKKLIILALPGPLHESVVELFHYWFSGLKCSLLKENVRLRLRGNQGLFPFHSN